MHSCKYTTSTSTSTTTTFLLKKLVIQLVNSTTKIFFNLICLSSFTRAALEPFLHSFRIRII
jgi:hypothetical protein